MNKKEKTLWALLYVLILIIVIIISIVVIDKNNTNKEDNDKENTIYINQLKNQIWLYYNSYFYNENEILPAIFDKFSLEFFDSDVKICFQEKCSISNYKINKNILSINSIIAGNYVITYNNDYLYLEYRYENGSKIKYCFTKAVG